ncbi:transcription termination factor MTERF4, chloroplastic-like [Zingiber officinale]|uniref:transcription termination factor MTERF4, chloroplastic-like n=1 Tax=Zingiber officinale TaxID=94328 RepID=UPI001C4B4C0B|nr:transcription termination factor MTERF4, chloroplastic-like [Zingiber officinale]
MFRRLCAAVHNRLQVTATFGHRRTAAPSCPHFLEFVKPYSASSVGADDPSSLTASSLIRSCGISDRAALSISKKVQLDTLDRALSVLTLLKDYGFDEAHLVRLVDRLPRVLVMDAEKTLRPKLEHFRRIGLVGTALSEILSAKPVLLGYSVEKRLLPNAELLKSFSITNAKLVNAIKSSPWLMTLDIRTKLLPKVDALRAYGVPDDVILVLFTGYGYALLTDTARFNEAFDKIKKMGICPKKTTFARALGMLALLPEKKWVEKVENFMGLGWSQDNVLEAFSKQPHIVRISTEKTRKIVEFLEEKLGWTPEHTVKYAVVLSMSLEKRLLPRCAVLSILMHKGLIKPGFTGNHFLMSSKNFQMEFVTKYQEQAPEIVEVIKGVKSCR